MAEGRVGESLASLAQLPLLPAPQPVPLHQRRRQPNHCACSLPAGALVGDRPPAPRPQEGLLQCLSCSAPGLVHRTSLLPCLLSRPVFHWKETLPWTPGLPSSLTQAAFYLGSDSLASTSQQELQVLCKAQVKPLEILSSKLREN